MSLIENYADCIARQRAVLRQLSVFNDPRKAITITLGDLRTLCDRIDKLERYVDLLERDALLEQDAMGLGEAL